MNRVRILLYVSLLLASFALQVDTVHAQGIRPQGIFRLRAAWDCELYNGEQTGRRYVMEQHLYDSIGRLHTNVFYTPPQNAPDYYTWQYYDGKTNVRTDNLALGKLNFRECYFYNDSGKLEHTDVYRISPADSTDTVLFMRVSYTYNEAWKPLRIVGRDVQNDKLIYSEDYTYSKPFGVLTRIRTKGDKPFDNEWISRLDVKHLTYDSVGNVLTETRIITSKDKGKHSFYRENKYDNRGRIATQANYTERNGYLTDSVCIKHFATGGFFSQDFYNAKGQRVRFIQYTDDRYLWGFSKQYY